MPAPAAGAAATFGFGTPWAPQLEFFRAKLNLPTEVWNDIIHAAHDRAFIVAGAAKADLLQDLRTAVDKSIATGDLAAFRKDFTALVAKNGWTGWTGEGSAAGTAWRTRVIYQTNMATSYAAGRWRQLNDPELLQSRPFWKYVHSDGVLHPRPWHLAWNGLTLPASHPFWKTHFAPNGWGCCCEIHPVRAPAPGAATAPPDGWDVADPETGEPVGIDAGFGYAPGANADTPLQALVDRKLINLAAPIGAQMAQALGPALAMERQQGWWLTLDEWLADPLPRGRTAVVGALTPGDLEVLAAKSQPLPDSAEIAVSDRLVVGAKQRRHLDQQNALTDDEWRSLPTLLRQPSGVYLDTINKHLVFVADGVGPAKLAVEFANASDAEALNEVVSTFRVSAESIAGMVKGGQWALVRVPGA
jgi:hypothetical protein